MSLWRDYLGRSIATTGQVYGLPEMGWSEKFTGRQQQTRPYLYGSLTGKPGAYTEPKPVYYGPTYSGPQQQTQQPTYQQTQQTQQPQGSSSSPTQWDRDHGYTGAEGNIDAWRQRKMAGGGGEGGPGGANNQALIDEYYKPAMEGLTRYGKELEGRLPEEESRISQASGRLGEDLKAETDKQIFEIEQQTGKTRKEKQNALSQARQMYQQLQQGLISRFGSGSSTGPAASEILARETGRTVGGIKEQATETIAELSRRTMDLHKFFSRESVRLTEDKDNKITDLRAQFQRELNKIASQRGEIESAKTAAKLDLIKEFRNITAQYNYDAWQAQLELDVWKQKQSALLSKSFSTMPTALSEGTLNSAQEAMLGQLALQKSKFQPGAAETSSLGPISYGTYKVPGDVEDEEKNLWNPYS